MRLSVTRVPFYSVCIAALLSWIVAFTDATAIVHLFNYGILALAAYVSLGNPGRYLRARSSTCVFFTLLAFYCVVAFLLHRIHPVSSITAIVLLTLAYVIFLNGNAVTPSDLRRQLIVVYVLHVAFIVFELIVLYFGYQEIFALPSGGRYRHLPGLVQLIWGMNMGVPNSLLLGPQAAGHLIMATLFLLYLSPNKDLGAGTLLALAGLLVLFFLTLSNTTVVILALLILVIVFLRGRRSKAFWLLVPPLSVLLVYVFFDQVAAVVLFKIYSNIAKDELARQTGVADTDMESYYSEFFGNPIGVINSLESVHLLFGGGTSYESFTNVEYADFGLGMLFIVHGFYLMALLLIWVAAIWFVGLFYARRFADNADRTTREWAALLFANVVLSAAWLLSTTHYLIAMKPGGTHLFAFSMAMVITSIARLRQMGKSRPEPRARMALEAA